MEVEVDMGSAYSMSKVYRKRWIQLLRSGRFRQGQGELVYTHRKRSSAEEITSYCCLGVLQYMLREEFDKSVESFVDEDILLDHELDELGINIPQSTLANMNDHGSPFPLIADWIEKNIKEAP